MEDGGIFEVADVSLEVMHAPGHTAGSVCLYCEELGVVFTGDVLTAAGRCRTTTSSPTSPSQLTAIGAQVLTLPSPAPGCCPATGAETSRGRGEAVRLLGRRRSRRHLRVRPRD